MAHPNPPGQELDKPVINDYVQKCHYGFVFEDYYAFHSHLRQSISEGMANKYIHYELEYSGIDPSWLLDLVNLLESTKTAPLASLKSSIGK